VPGDGWSAVRPVQGIASGPAARRCGPDERPGRRTRILRGM